MNITSRRQSRPTWAIFTNPSHRPFFDTLSTQIKAKFPAVDILVADKEHHFFSGPTMSLASHALFRSEISFIDTECPAFNNILSNAEGNRLSYVIVATDSVSLNEKLKATEKGHFPFRGGIVALDEKKIFYAPEDALQNPVGVKVADDLIGFALDVGKRQLFLSYAGEDREFADHIAAFAPCGTGRTGRPIPGSRTMWLRQPPRWA